MTFHCVCNESNTTVCATIGAELIYPIFSGIRMDESVVLSIVFCRYVITPMNSVLITTKVVSSNHAQGDVYTVQNYMIRFVSNLQHKT